jgi:tetratricopeptide (TPR) repeat protein
MDVKRTARPVLCGACLLGLSLGASRAAADDASEMVIVTASDSGVETTPAPRRAAPAEPSDLVIHFVDDADESPRESPDAEFADGSFALVGDAAAALPPDQLIVDGDVVPAGHAAQHGRALERNWDGIMTSGPRRPSAAAGIQGPQRVPQYPSAGYVGNPQPRMQADRHTLGDAPPAYDGAERPPVARKLPPAPAPAAASKVSQLKPPAEHAKELLVKAYQLSLSASTEAEYSQIVQWCATAGRVELDADSRAFADNLAAWALNRRGQVRADEGQVDLALADFRGALDTSPTSWRALHNRAVTFAQRGEFAESFDDLCRVIQLNPKFAKAYANRATLYVQAGDLERALDDYNSALAVDAELLPALVGRGRVCHMLGRLEQALPSLDAAVRLAPQDAEIVCSRADLLADLGQYEDALLDYAQAIDLNSKFEHAYRNGAWLLATCPEDSIRDVEGALAGAQAALDCGYGERHAALDTMAAALANAGRFAEAVGMIQQAIEVAPESVRAAYQARQQLYEAGEPFRTQPVGADHVAAAGADDAQSAVYIEE